MIAIAYIFISALAMFAYEPDTFDSFFHALYWATTALTTVGYGDVYPVTDVGKLISMVSSLFGIAVIAMPAGIITSSFMEEISRDKEPLLPGANNIPPLRFVFSRYVNAVWQVPGRQRRMRTMSKTKRYLIVMLLSVLMNQGFYILASDNGLDLPFWLDFTGTAFAAIVLEPAAGLLVGFVNNFYLAVTLGNTGNIIYFAVSAAIAVICGVCMRKGGRLSTKRILPTMGLLIAVTAVISTLLTIWRTGGRCDSKWELFYYDIAMGWNWGKYVSCFLVPWLLRFTIPWQPLSSWRYSGLSCRKVSLCGAKKRLESVYGFPMNCYTGTRGEFLFSSELGSDRPKRESAPIPNRWELPSKYLHSRLPWAATPKYQFFETSSIMLEIKVIFTFPMPRRAEFTVQIAPNATKRSASVRIMETAPSNTSVV